MTRKWLCARPSLILLATLAALCFSAPSHAAPTVQRKAQSSVEQFAFTQNNNVYLMHATGGGRQTVTTQGIGYQTVGGIVYPWYSWSPDGRYILLVKWRTTGNSGILFLLNQQGTVLRTLATLPAPADFWPTWAIDADQIAFVAAQRTDQAYGGFRRIPTRRHFRGSKVDPTASQRALSKRRQTAECMLLKQETWRRFSLPGLPLIPIEPFRHHHMRLLVAQPRIHLARTVIVAKDVQRYRGNLQLARPVLQQTKRLARVPAPAKRLEDLNVIDKGSDLGTTLLPREPQHTYRFTFRLVPDRIDVLILGRNAFRQQFPHLFFRQTQRILLGHRTGAHMLPRIVRDHACHVYFKLGLGHRL